MRGQLTNHIAVLICSILMGEGGREGGRFGFCSRGVGAPWGAALQAVTECPAARLVFI